VTQAVAGRVMTVIVVKSVDTDCSIIGTTTGGQLLVYLRLLEVPVPSV
jgi:hypothetical protein